MIRSITTVLALLSILTVPASAWAKGKTVRIEIAGPTLEAPVEISDASVVRQFSVWTGPGVGGSTPSDTRSQEGAFIDWPKGVLKERPKGLQSYEVKFYCSRARAPNDIHLGYVVTYEYNPSKKGGYIYLPGPTDDEFKLNTAIYHGVEGNWFRASAAWEELVRPLVQKAVARDRAPTQAQGEQSGR